MNVPPDDIKKLAESVEEIRLALLGDMHEGGNRGLVHNMITVMGDVYGDDRSKKVGMLMRVSNLEIVEVKRSAWLSGASWVGGAIGGIVGFIGAWALKLFHKP